MQPFDLWCIYWTVHAIWWLNMNAKIISDFLNATSAGVSTTKSYNPAQVKKCFTRLINEDKCISRNFSYGLWGISLIFRGGAGCERPLHINHLHKKNFMIFRAIILPMDTCHWKHLYKYTVHMDMVDRFLYLIYLCAASIIIIQHFKDKNS